MNVYLAAALAIAFLMHFTFFFAVKTRRNDLADVVWGPGFWIAAFAAIQFRTGGEDWSIVGNRELLIMACVAIWAIRLFVHIGKRVIQKPREDARYSEMRQGWGDRWVVRSYFVVFVLQGILMFVVSLAFLRAFELSPRPVTTLVWLGVAVWLIGFLFETIGDRQLKNFMMNPENKGRLMTTGLWSWSRHPNYFGEVAQWWGIFLMAVDLSSWWIVISPLTITFLILKVSGVPLLEAMMRTRPGFDEYRNRTSIFFPRPPRRAKSQP